MNQGVALIVVIVSFLYDPMMSKKIVENYEIHTNQMLGEGGFGTVCKCTNRSTNEDLAIKMINKRTMTNDEYKLQALKSEISLLHKIKSQHIVRFRDVFQTQRNYYIVMELCDGDLRKLMKKNQLFSQNDAIGIMSQILKGFYHMIIFGYVHRDLKPENVLFKGDIIKLSDFGLSKRFHNKKLLDTAVGTKSYQAPQILTNDKYTYKCDIWAFGLIFYELLYGTLPYSSLTIDSLIKEFQENFIIEFPKQPEVRPEVKELIKKCLIVDEEKRADWDDLFSHAIFAGRVENISNLKKRFKYILGKIRSEINESNIDLNEFFSLIKSQKNELTQAQFSKMLEKITSDLEIEDIKYIFSQFDKNLDGKISFDEFEECLRENQISFTSVGRTQMKKQVKKCEGEELNPTERENQKKLDEAFTKLTAYVLKQKLEDILESFFKKESEEGVDLENFIILLKELCPELTKDECVLLFDKFDEDKNKSISYGEFYKYLFKMLGKPFGKSFIH